MQKQEAGSHAPQLGKQGGDKDAKDARHCPEYLTMRNDDLRFNSDKPVLCYHINK